MVITSAIQNMLDECLLHTLGKKYNHFSAGKGRHYLALILEDVVEYVQDPFYGSTIVEIRDIVEDVDVPQHNLPASDIEKWYLWLDLGGPRDSLFQELILRRCSVEDAMIDSLLDIGRNFVDMLFDELEDLEIPG